MSTALAGMGGDCAAECTSRPKPRVLAGAFVWAFALLGISSGVVIAALGAAAFGIHLSRTTVALLVLGAVACEIWPARRMVLAFVTGLALLTLASPAFALYQVLTVAALFAVRHSSARLLTLAGLLCLVVPKTLFVAHYHEPRYYNWLSESHLALTFFVTLYLWRQRKDGRAPSLAPREELLGWGLLFGLPGHIANPMVFGPRDLWRSRGLQPREAAVCLGRLAMKAGIMLLWQLGAARWSFAALGPTAAAQVGVGPLWTITFWNYGATLLQLSGTAEVAVALAHLYGFPLPPPFRFAFLAWNPVELWRRWGLYNRRFLLSLFYFPLGGSKRHRTRNVLLTFLGSALVLHSGWFGSKYWEVGTGGWRDETLYFLLQGAAVVGCLAYWRLRGKDPGAKPAAFGLSHALGLIATQAFSAWAHLLVLPQGLSLGLRVRLMARCLTGL